MLALLIILYVATLVTFYFVLSVACKLISKLNVKQYEDAHVDYVLYKVFCDAVLFILLFITMYVMKEQQEILVISKLYYILWIIIILLRGLVYKTVVMAYNIHYDSKNTGFKGHEYLIISIYQNGSKMYYKNRILRKNIEL